VEKSRNWASSKSEMSMRDPERRCKDRAEGLRRQCRPRADRDSDLQYVENSQKEARCGGSHL
jgi:hypothetical protein